MPEGKLKLSQREVLFALMALARDVTNPELRELCGLTLVGADRRGLNDQQLVDSVKVGPAFRHSLTDRGWRWCQDEFSQSAAEDARPLERVVYLVFSRLEKFFERRKITVTEVFVDLAERIRKEYHELAAEPSAWVSLTDLRSMLGDAPREEVDQALITLDGTKNVTLMPESNQKTLTAADRAAAVRIGGEDNHLIAMAE
ncbi:hypothetical protein [Amycolatopsis saalfeldensis]|uniref:Uncharacterized protein n=1 Tax=Amycolatopsis saalfeldensis TaxID=394193 RepID=A0A1H8W2U2_9PSEU|nr:hypothetical protein [Amycolatopsis saalfeldensis]SEP21498.1 hypothetical protein SAMN04489732_104473 [Amycolatopsis saalfeldensis]